MSEVAALPTLYRLNSESLLSKWGFDDGDIFDDLCWALEQDEGIEVERHDVLKAAVRRWLLPALRQRVEVVEIGTIHNPIRASLIDGKESEHWWYGGEDSGELSPRFVEVATGDLLDLARSLAPIEGVAVEVAPMARRLNG